MRTTEASTKIALRNILFATDFEPDANVALRYAADLAQRFGAKLYALHVKEPAKYALPPQGWKSADEVCEIYVHELRRTLLSAFPGLQNEVLIAEGTVWQVVASAVEKNKIDLVVVGTRGRTGLGKVLLGSQAEEILRHVPCPVLVVGPHSPLRTDRGGKLAEFLYATDFGPDSETAVRCAILLAQQRQGHLTLLHVIAKPRTGELVHTEQLVDSSLRRLQALVPEAARPWCEAQCLVEEGAAAEKILEVAERVHADLIVLGVREPTGLPGASTHLPITVVHKVISHANCPVLAVRTRPKAALKTA
ncbi:MAG TPA: universal stress protein [Candidatus Acidoferrales bacterium]|nr:universal stress protein [Candidatus Acidoferrales bacterium]